MNESELIKLVSVAGIERVVWIDDDFAVEPLADNESIFRQLINISRRNKVSLSEPVLASLISSDNDDVIEEQVARFLAGNADRIESFIAKLQETSPPPAPVAESSTHELVYTQRDILRRSFKNLRPLSLADWYREKDQIKASLNRDTLLFVDQDFTKEGATEREGEDILADLCGNGDLPCPCIMLTGTTSETSAQKLREEIATRNAGRGLEIHHFNVLSKASVDTELTAHGRQFAQCLRVALTHLISIRLVKRMVEAAGTALSSVMTKLISTSIEQIDQAVFESSLDEGSSELDVIERIIMLEQKNSFGSVAASNDVVVDLSRLRNIRRLVALAPKPASTPEENQFRQWRQLEVETPGSIINPLHSPLMCGDVFRKRDSSKFYVFLAQPCDLIIRPLRKGEPPSRKAKEGVLILLHRQKILKLPGTASFKIEVASSPTGYWWLDFRHFAGCNIEALELCVLNNDGSLAVSTGHTLPDILLPHWNVYAGNILSTFRANPEAATSPFDRITLNSSEIKGATGKWNVDKTLFSFEYLRVGRLNAHIAQSALAAFASHHTRAALDADFAQAPDPVVEEGSS